MCDTSKKDIFDFEHWARLAQSDPEAFETERRAAVASILDEAPPDIRRNLECLQWKIDQVRGRAPNPLSACMRISDLMWDRALGTGGLLSAVECLADPSLPLGRGKTADIVPLHPPQDLP